MNLVNRDRGKNGGADEKCVCLQRETGDEAWIGEDKVANRKCSLYEVKCDCCCCIWVNRVGDECQQVFDDDVLCHDPRR